MDDPRSSRTAEEVPLSHNALPPIPNLNDLDHVSSSVPRGFSRRTSRNLFEKPRDIDWFLRDSVRPRSVSLTDFPPSLVPVLDSPLVHPTALRKAPSSTQVPPQLNTAISNSRAANPTKTKASVELSPNDVLLQDLDTGSTHHRRRSALSSSATSPSSSGFFSKLRGKFSYKSSDDDHAKAPQSSNTSSISTSSRSRRASLTRADFIKAAQTPDLMLKDLPKTPVLSNSKPQDPVSPDSDPQLLEYIKFYGQKRIPRSYLDANISVEPCCLEPKSPGKFSFLRRHSTLPLIHSEQMTSPRTRMNSVPSSSTPTSPISGISGSGGLPLAALPLPMSFQNLKPLRRVAFHLSTFLIDPPQQIPARNPRIGNVEVRPSGEVVIRPLTEEEKALVEDSQMGKGGGVVVGGSGSLSSVQCPPDSPCTSSSEIGVSSPGDVAVSEHARSLGVDKPMISRVRSSQQVVKKMALDLMYTRCCHLREILPVPSILKQIPSGSMDPLPLLQFRNPIPTIIEIQSFADFIRIAPVICISLDGVSLTLEQFRILLSAMSSKKHLEKLSLRNTALDHQGWALLCWFLSRNTALNRLDITQCPSLPVNVLKRKTNKNGEPKPDEDHDRRMKCNAENRSDMDWSLFIATLVARGGIEDLVLTGCRITDADVFERLVRMALLIRTTRLGLAYNQISPRHLEIVFEHWLFQGSARGLDLGYNDFLSSIMSSTIINSLRHKEKTKDVSKCSLTFLSLNATNLRFSNLFKEVFEHFIMKLPALRYIDLSNNPRLFMAVANSNGSATGAADSTSVPSENECIVYFTSKLPMFPSIARLHLENNNISQETMVSFAKTFPFCPTLRYVSLLGNYIDDATASVLVEAIKSSKSLVTLDCDTEGLPSFFREKIGLYTMRNMERLLYAAQESNSQDDTCTSSDSLTEQLNNLLELKAGQGLDLQSKVVRTFLNKASNMRRDLKQLINELLTLQLRNELNLEGKETLLRFIFIDSCIEKGLQLIDPLLNTETLNLMVICGVSEDEKKRFERPGDELDAATMQSLSVPPIKPAISTSSSRVSLNQLQRQEGSMLKLSKLHDFHSGGQDAEPDGKFYELLQGISGEEIRLRLKNAELSDLDRIISDLETLKERGILLKRVFCRDEASRNAYNQEMEKDVLDFDRIHRNLEKFANIESIAQLTRKNSFLAQNRRQSVATDTSALPGASSSGPEEEIIGTYDKVFERYAEGNQES